MSPLSPEKLLTATFVAVAALLLAAPANAKPFVNASIHAAAPAAVAPDAVDRAVLAQATADNGPTVLHKSGTVVVVDSAKPAWLKALEARSQGMNDYYGISTTTSVRPDDRAVPRPVPGEPVVAATSTSGDGGTEWGDIAIGALGGFGIGLIFIGGTLVALRNRRQDGGVALP